MKRDYTVKQLAALANVTVRTLHHYDAIGLLSPALVGANSYRYYGEAELLRLQQILLYREMGVPLEDIKRIIDQPTFDLVDALHTHRKALEGRMQQTKALLETVDTTIAHLLGETNMANDKDLYLGFDPEQQKQYEREARLQYGPEVVNESVKRWESYSKAQQQAILEEGSQVYRELAQALEGQVAAQDERVQLLLMRWHQHIRYFYEPTTEVLRGLAELYTTDAAFGATFAKFHTGLAEYMKEGIQQYVDVLETRALEHMLAQDEARSNRLSE
jgi:MerR family transcriptional regulator, thiopeptide resistance regulator